VTYSYACKYHYIRTNEGGWFHRATIDSVLRDAAIIVAALDSQKHLALCREFLLINSPSATRLSVVPRAREIIAANRPEIAKYPTASTKQGSCKSLIRFPLSICSLMRDKDDFIAVIDHGTG
jgi:hypothetical protein